MASDARLEDLKLTQAELALNELVHAHGLNQHAWLKTLDEFDEPPLFTRAEDVSFLSEVPAHRRGPLLLRCMASVLDSVADFLATHERREHFYASLTFMSWDLVRDGTQPIPRASLLVSPNWERELAEFRLRAPTSVEGREVQDWLSKLERRDLVVAEATLVPDEVQRIYVGYRDLRPFKSVGDFLEHGTARPS